MLGLLGYMMLSGMMLWWWSMMLDLLGSIHTAAQCFVEPVEVGIVVVVLVQEGIIDCHHAAAIHARRLHSALSRSIEVILELNLDLPLARDILEESVPEELVGVGSLRVVLDEDGLDERVKLFAPLTGRFEARWRATWDQE